MTTTTVETSGDVGALLDPGILRALRKILCKHRKRRTVRGPWTQYHCLTCGLVTEDR